MGTVIKDSTFQKKAGGHGEGSRVRGNSDKALNVSKKAKGMMRGTEFES